MPMGRLTRADNSAQVGPGDPDHPEHKLIGQYVRAVPHDTLVRRLTGFVPLHVGNVR
jgi:hypothetical protein